METAKCTTRKGKLPHYADGGFIGAVRRMVMPKGEADKQTPPDKPTMAPLVRGSLDPKNALREREAAAGLAKGGAVKDIRPGGKIEGPGTATSDDVHLMGSNGEFMIKASAVKKIGIEVLEALNELGDEPDEDKDSPAEKKAEYGMKCGGAVRKMATGGLLEDDINNKAVFGLYPQMTDNQRTTYATGNKLRSGVVATGPRSFEPALTPGTNIQGGGDGLRLGAIQDPRSLGVGSNQPAATPTVATAATPAPTQAPVPTASATPAIGARPFNGSVSSLDTSAGYAADQKALAEIEQKKQADIANMQSQERYAQNNVLQQRALGGNRAAAAILAGNTQDATARRGQDIQAGASRQNTLLAQQKLALESTSAGIDNQSKTQALAGQKQLSDAQAEYLAAGNDPVKLKAAERKLAVLTGKSKDMQDEYAYAPGGQTVDPATGLAVTQPGVIYNKRTGQLAPQTQTAAKPAQNFEAGKVYTDAKGNRARWDGKQFVPA